MFKLTRFLWVGVILFLTHSAQAHESSNIKAVVFDFGGVVAKADRSQVMLFLKKSFCIDDSELEALLNQWKICLVEKSDEKTFWQEYACSVGIALPADFFCQFEQVKSFAFTAIPETLAVIKELQQNGYQTPMLSNVNSYHADLIAKLGYYDLFDPVLLSYEIGVEKPDPKAYEILLEQLHLKASSIIFIDDREENTEAAEQLGICSILFSDPTALKENLKKNGIVFNKE
ncbi:MAG: Alpha-D-glucose 1-phosphate phosphatase YihX [Chlamydiales bacterium]|nr:Alpha-D-glucose 1-phosphate phosphatase YihX [Chlamydiales bacterium]